MTGVGGPKHLGVLPHAHTKLLCIYVTILLLFPYQLLLSKLEVVLPIFALKPTLGSVPVRCYGIANILY